MATAFIGYVLIWGQMSFWGEVLPEMVESKTPLKVSLPLIKLRSYIVSTKRIGPHNKDFLEFLQGSLLGDSYLERHGNGSRLCLQQESSHKAYLLWSHKFLASRGYCNPKIPEIQSRLGIKGKLRYVLRLKTWTFSSLNYLHNDYYINNIKVIPLNFNLTPLMLAIWIKDDGSRSGQALKLSTNNFTLNECNKLKDQLLNFNLKVSIHETGTLNQYN